MNSRNIGKFSINIYMLRNELDNVAKIFKNMDLVVLRAECSFVQNTIDYIGLSPKFPEVPEGVEVPEYEIVAHKSVNLTVECHRQGNKEKPLCRLIEVDTDKEE
jgi:hypothetical protein